MIEWLKAHKVWVIGGVVALFVLYLITRSSSGTSATSSGVGTDVAAATALQTAQLQAQAQGAQVQAASQAASQQTAAQEKLGELSIAQAGAHDQLAATVATSQINSNLQLQSLLGQLSSNVAIKQSDNAVAAQTVAVNGQVQMQQVLASSLIHAYDTNATIASSHDAATVAIQSSHDQHSGGLFGGGGFLGLGI